MSASPVNLNSTSAAAAASSSSTSSSSSSSTDQSAIDALGNPDTFLQLLVAQLQYQDPESPADGTAFVTQLATFSGVEEQSAMRSDLDSINTVAQAWSGGPAALTTPAASSTSTTPAAGASGSAADSTANSTNNTTGTSN